MPSPKSKSLIKFLTLALTIGLIVPNMAQALAFDGPKGAPFGPAIAAPENKPYPGLLKVKADLTDIDRRIVHIEQTIPVSNSGEMVFMMAKWLPGKHHPFMNQVARIGGLSFKAGNQSLVWKRNPLDAFAFHVEIPEGTQFITINFDYLSPTLPSHGRIVMTSEMLNWQWEMGSFYPAGHYTSQIRIQPSIKLPTGWQVGTALKALLVSANNEVTFEETHYEALIDSPIFAGKYFKRITLSEAGKTPITMAVVADKPEMLAISDEAMKAHKSLVIQAERLFGSFAFDRYEFLVAASTKLGSIGLEHHRSSENRVSTKHFTDWKNAYVGRDLLPHELTHSWNGKHRRPNDLWTSAPSVPMRDQLLWVYEGQTDYWGTVLAARSGFFTKDQALELLAITAATYENLPGRSWRSLDDTTQDPIISGRTFPQIWPSYQRAEDYYDEGTLMWLEVDVKLRQLTNNKASLDDFARSFFGQSPGDWRVDTYDFDEVVATLNAIKPYDWAAYFKERLSSKSRAPMGGIIDGGYDLIFEETPSAYFKASEEARGALNHNFSLGLSVGRDLSVVSVLWGSPSYEAGIVPGSAIMAINGKTASWEALTAAISAAKSDKKPIEMVIRHDDNVKTIELNYSGGLRYPILRRNMAKPALLDSILIEKPALKTKG